MPKSSDIFGISKLEIGDPGDGIMGAALEEFNDLKEGQATLILPKEETIKIFSETRRGVPYRVISAGNADGPMIACEFLGILLADWLKFLGGTFSTGKWTYPPSKGDLYKSVRLTTKPTDATGTILVFELPYALLTAGIDGPITFNDLTAIQCTMEAMMPVSAIDVEGDVMTVEEV